MKPRVWAVISCVLALAMWFGGDHDAGRDWLIIGLLWHVLDEVTS